MELRRKKVRARSEIFTTPNLGPRAISLDVSRMRTWAEMNLQPHKVRIDAGHVKWLLDGGNINEDRIINHTIEQIPKPILICEHPSGAGYEIVDGNHTYVATALSWAACIEQGLVPADTPPFVIGYSLNASQWRQFVVSI